MPREAKVKYFGKSHDPHYLKVCGYCGEPAWMSKKSLYCSLSCAKLGSPTYTPRHFQGSRNDYVNWHNRLSVKRGQADKCCNGCITAKYTWANLTGNFEDPHDYVMMCIACHYRFDRYRVAVIVGILDRRGKLC
jgi:hypothetical protein